MWVGMSGLRRLFFVYGSSGWCETFCVWLQSWPSLPFPLSRPPGEGVPRQRWGRGPAPTLQKDLSYGLFSFPLPLFYHFWSGC
jgi:hypothetical protein